MGNNMKKLLMTAALVLMGTQASALTVYYTGVSFNNGKMFCYYSDGSVVVKSMGSCAMSRSGG